MWIRRLSVVAVLALAMAASVAGAGLIRGGVAAAGQALPGPAAAQAPAQPTEQPDAAGAAEKAKEADAASLEQYESAFITALAGHLGVTEAQLNSAYAAAFSDVLTRAVGDGKLTQEQADQFRQKTPGPSLPFGLLKGRPRDDQDNPKAQIAAIWSQLEAAEAQALGMSTADLESQLASGQSLGDLAIAHNIPAQQLQDAVLQTARTELDAGMQAGRWTQAQADAAYDLIAGDIGGWVNGRNVAADRNNPKGRLAVVIPQVEQTEADLLGISLSDLQTNLQNGQTLAALANAHGVAVDTLKNTILTTLRAQLDAGTHDGKWNQAEADESYQLVADGIDVFVSQSWKR